MHFTASQRKGILFILVFFQIAVVYHVLDRWLHPVQRYDFSAFEEKFSTRYDSIQNYLQQADSNRAALQSLASPAPGLASPLAPALPLKRSPQPVDQSRRLININTATLEELTTLPRIGPKIAARIVEYRSQHGAFAAKKELTKVNGIGPKTYEQIQHLITVE